MLNRIFRNEGMRYLIIGFLTTVINIGIYKALLILGSAYGIATTLAFVFAVLFAYWGNYRLVFRAKPSAASMFKFYATRIATFFGETAGLILCIEALHMDAFMAKLGVNVVIIILNYVVSKVWIFKGDQREGLD